MRLILTFFIALLIPSLAALRAEDSTSTPIADNALMLAGDWLPEDPHQIDYEKLPQVTAEHAVISDVRDRAGTRVNQHAYLAHHDGRFWAMWSDGPGLPKRGVTAEQHRDIVPGHDRPGTRNSFATSEDGLHWTAPSDLTGPPRISGFGWIARGLWKRDGELLALASHFNAPGYDGPGLSLEAFRFGGGKWGAHGTVLDDSMNNFPPKRLPSGEWMMTRRDHQRQVSVMVGGTKAFDDWRINPLAAYNGTGRPEEPYWYILPDGKTIIGLIRDNGGSKFLLRTFSRDNGETWSEIQRTNFPDATSKFFVHRTSRGYYVMVSNSNPRRRDPLTLAVSHDGLVFSKLFRLIGGRHIDYPHIIEHDEHLLVAFSGAKQTVEVVKVPLDELERLSMPESVELTQPLSPVKQIPQQPPPHRSDLGGPTNVRSAATRKALPNASVIAGEEEELDADVVVYGGTSGGVVAAVQAARMGKRVILLEPGRRLGGMTSGGLSAVDIGEPRSVGGIAREYFSRLVASYGKTLNWGQPFKGKGGPATGGAYSIEPHVAEGVFEALVRQAGVTVLRDARLSSVKKDGARIAELTTQDARTIRAKMFLDTTYEGDLLAAAGVSYTLMREGNAKYGETYNGIHYAEKYKPRVDHLKPGANGRVPGGQGVWDRDFPLDPYVVTGDPASGLLPLINEGEPGTPGDAAPGVMAYCFRLCLSTAADRLPIAPPPDYDPKDYELVARFIAACQEIGDDMDLRWFSKHDPLPNQKWDFNTATFGGNLPGASWEWPEATYDRRAEIAKAIENYHRGLLHFLATDPRVPEKVRTDMARFGLPHDEFTDRGGWPHQVYVREGRRMVSDMVLTEHHTFGREIAPDSVGLGSYGTDIHEIRRIAKDGVVIREGKVAGGRGGFGPYQIGYTAIVPKQSECENLFATFALSASHSAFASLRMEPVFMVTSQSAATAACLAIDHEVAVQEVDYETLKTHLLADGQILSWPPPGTALPVAKPRNIVSARNLPGIVFDDSAAEYQGAWATSSAQPSPIGDRYRHDGNQGRGEKSATFTATIPEAGVYEVRLLFTWHENRSSKTKVVVVGAAEPKAMRINQREPLFHSGVPDALGMFRFEAGAKARVIVSNEGADGHVIVDGLQILPIELAREERAGHRTSGYAE